MADAAWRRPLTAEERERIITELSTTMAPKLVARIRENIGKLTDDELEEMRRAVLTIQNAGFVPIN